MNTMNFFHNARRALVPMRKSIIDAILLGSLVNLFLLVSGVLFSLTWLSIVVYILIYLLAVVLRLRHAARQMTAVPDHDPSLEEAHRELASPRTFIGLALFWGNRPF